MPNLYAVSEMFGVTIQGEGLHAGRPCVFLRLAHCNFWKDPDKKSKVCPFCDTPQLHRGMPYTSCQIKEFLRNLRKDSPSCGLVITGGEPYLQLDQELADALFTEYDWVDIETNGSLAPKFTTHDSHVFISCAPKSSNLKVTDADWYKVLIPSKEHLLPMVVGFCCPIYLQPVEPQYRDGGGLNTEVYRENVQRCVDISKERGYPISLQLHKYLELP